MKYFLNYQVNEQQRIVSLDGKDLKVSALNYDLLICFLNHPETILSKDQLMSEAWQGRIISDTTLYKQINRLKEELQTSEQEQEIIKTLRGQGWLFTPTISNHKLTPSTEFSSSSKRSFPWTSALTICILILSLSYLTVQVSINQQQTEVLKKRVEKLAITYQADDLPSAISSKVFAQALKSQLLVNDQLNVGLEQIDQSFEQTSMKLVQELDYNWVLNVDFISHTQGIKAKVLLKRGTDLVHPTIFETPDFHQMVYEITAWLKSTKLADDHVILQQITESTEAFDLYMNAMTRNFEGKQDQAIELLNEAIQMDSQFLIAKNMLAGIYRARGQVNQALLLLGAIDLSQASARQRYLVLNNKGTCYYRIGKLNQAVEAYDDALIEARNLQDQGYMLTTLINQAYIFADLSRTESAKKNLQEALLYVNKNHQKSYLGGIYSALTSISLTEDQIDDALKYAAMSYRAFKEAGNEGYSYVALNKWADVLLHDTQYEMAYEKYQEVLVHSLNIDELVNRMYALKSMVTIDMIYGRFTAARSYLNDLQTLLTSVDNEDVMAEYLALEVQYHLNKQLYDQAKNYLNQLSEQVMTLQNPGKVYSKDLLSVRYFMAVKQWEQAQEAIDEAQHGQQSSAILSLLQTTVLTHTQSDNNFTDKFAELVRQSLGQNNKELSMEVLVQAINYLQSKGLHLKQQQIWLEKLEDMNAPPFPYLKLKAFNQASQGQFQAAQQTIFRLSEEGNEWWQESYRHLGSEE